MAQSPLTAFMNISKAKTHWALSTRTIIFPKSVSLKLKRKMWRYINCLPFLNYVKILTSLGIYPEPTKVPWNPYLVCYAGFYNFLKIMYVISVIEQVKEAGSIITTSKESLCSSHLAVLPIRKLVPSIFFHTI